MDIRPQIPVILCTGFNETISEEKALAMGINKFVMKPVVKDELASTIRKVLDNRPTLPN
jgi:CheY-like chemotaxis protein